MKLLLFSDVHCDQNAARRLEALSHGVDVVVGAGDFAKQRVGLGPLIGGLSVIRTPSVVVPGNNETEQELRAACREWPAARVLHAEAAEVEGLRFFGLGCGIPPIGKEWSFDLTEDEAARLFETCPEGIDVLVVHSPPKGHADVAGGEHVGSEAVRAVIEAKRPRVAVCGHIHDCWGQESRLGETVVINAGPKGRVVEV